MKVVQWYKGLPEILRRLYSEVELVDPIVEVLWVFVVVEIARLRRSAG